MEGSSLKYFDLAEFDSPDQPGSGEEMKMPFLKRLEVARRMAGVPFRITSGYRTPEHNEFVGGVANSAHLNGWAADIKVDNQTRYTVLRALMDAGFNRIGIGKTFIHCDLDPSKNSQRIWTY